MTGLDLDLVRHALEIARRDGFAEIELESGDDKFRAILAPRKKAAPKRTPPPWAQLNPKPRT